jgi:hypothetical protein
MTSDEHRPPYVDYIPDPIRVQPAPERVPDPHYRSSVFIMLDDEPATAERWAKAGWEWDGPAPVRQWRATDEGEFDVLGEFAGTRDEAIAWALARPDVREIYLYSEETKDIAPLDRSGGDPTEEPG